MNNNSVGIVHDILISLHRRQLAHRTRRTGRTGRELGELGVDLVFGAIEYAREQHDQQSFVTLLTAFVVVAQRRDFLLRDIARGGLGLVDRLRPPARGLGVR
jgi:hypothetical protein